MREIKFRAWDEETERMLYSDRDYEECTFICESDGLLKCFVSETVPQTEDEPEHTIGREIVPIMKYTGLKDKNGKEIYEGDIIVQTHLYAGDQIGVVTYKAKLGHIAGWLCGDFYHMSSMMKSIEVIGNIHQNKELLEAKP